ncbi:mitochondrial ribosomal protein L47 isoform X2 [Nomia melanderi]|uniref:mitochondrial ribosomal protein L47 isoform X2 n=1 Tax=Nomia melanderi TaxID=2448451 RepID=UPI003FCC624A
MVPTFQFAFIHTTTKRNDLMEFFDDKENWGKDQIKVGRSWRIDELRLKSNEDLHKLWFVLLKERNMLLTMEEAYKDLVEYFPNPERIDKVKNSMYNLETVVRERNQAYHMLETGESGERPSKIVYSQIGLRYVYCMTQHKIPKCINRGWQKRYQFGFRSAAVCKFIRLYREKCWNEKRRARNRQFRAVVGLARVFPNLDWEAVREKYPLADIEKAKRMRKAIGHYIPE